LIFSPLQAAGNNQISRKDHQMPRFKHAIGSLIIMLLMFGLSGQPASARDVLSKGETVYVSIYSHVYSGPKLQAFQLTAMLIARNTDPHHPITITSAEYYNTKGDLVEEYVTKPIVLKPLEASYLSIKEYDERGGAGANFIVKWRSETKVNQPIIESVNLGTRGGQGISFTCPGKVITEIKK
jgi:hypothetical protein